MNKLISSLAAVALLAMTVVVGPVFAAGVTVTDVLSVTTASTASNHTVTFTSTSGVPANGTIKVTFPAGFVIGSVDNTDVDLTDDATDVVIAATPSGTTWGAAFSGQVLTLTNGSSAVGAGSVIVIEIGTNATADVAGDAQITNPVAGNYGVLLTTSAGDYGAMIVPVGNANLVSVTATVDPTFSFSLSGNALTFAAPLSTTAQNSSAAITATVSTNATGGVAVKARSKGNGNGTSGNGSAGLLSGANLIPAAASTAVTNAGAAGYGIFANNAQNSAVIDEGFDADSTSDVAISTTDANIFTGAAPVAVASADVTARAVITGVTSAGSYVDTLTFTATPTF